MRISHTPLASKVKQALLIVNSVKLHLTALNSDPIFVGVLVLQSCLPLEERNCQSFTRPVRRTLTPLRILYVYLVINGSPFILSE